MVGAATPPCRGSTLGAPPLLELNLPMERSLVTWNLNSYFYPPYQGDFARLRGLPIRLQQRQRLPHPSFRSNAKRKSGQTMVIGEMNVVDESSKFGRCSCTRLSRRGGQIAGQYAQIVADRASIDIGSCWHRLSLSRWLLSLMNMGSVSARS